MRKTIDDLKKQVEVLTDVVLQFNSRQVSSCHCSPRPTNDLIENSAVCDTSALSVDQSCSMGSFKGKVASDEFPPIGATRNSARSNISQDIVGGLLMLSTESHQPITLWQ